MQREHENGRSCPTIFPSFLVLDWTVKRVVVASSTQSRGKPDSGFPLPLVERSLAVGMWESRGVGEISKGGWGEWETCFWFSSLSMGPPFPPPWLAQKMRAGIGDSDLHRRNNLTLAALIFRAHSVSLMAVAKPSRRWKLSPALRHAAASGSD